MGLARGPRLLCERGQSHTAALAAPRRAHGLLSETEAGGREGFRSTHEEALAAHRIASAAERPVTHYEDVALEVLAGQDPERARAFVSRELRGIDGEDARSQRLRETLREYFAAHQNAAPPPPRSASTSRPWPSACGRSNSAPAGASPPGERSSIPPCGYREDTG